MRQSIKHNRSTILRKCLKSLKDYAVYRRKKNLQKRKLADYAESQLVYRIYHMWIDKYNQRKKELAMEDQLNSFKNKYLIARTMHRWRSEYKFSVLLRIKQIKVKKFYEKNLKKRAFAALKNHHLEIQLIKQDYVKANHFFTNWQKKRFFIKWTTKLEDKNDMKQMHLFYKSKKHFEMNLMRKNLKLWCLSHQQLLAEKEKEMKAIDFHNKNLLAYYLNKIKDFVDLNKIKRCNYERANEISRQNIFYKYFTKWQTVYTQTLDFQMNNRIAILHYESHLKEVTYLRWTNKFNQLLINNYKQTRANDYYKKNLIKSHFKMLKNNLIQSKQEQQFDIISKKFNFKRLCLPIYKEWRRHIDDCRQESLKDREANLYYEKKLKLKLFKSWRTQTVNFKRTNQIVEELFKYQSNMNQLRLFHHWQRTIKFDKLQRQNDLFAQTLYFKQLMSKVIRKWHTFTKEQTKQRHTDTLKIEHFNSINRKLQLNHYYQIWKTRSNIKMSDKYKKLIATNYSNNTVIVKLFHAWKLFAAESKKLKMMNLKANWLHTMSLKAAFFYKWTKKYNSEVELKEKNERALLFWSMEVQKKCFKSWHQRSQHRHQKKIDYEKILAERQLDIMSECARRFLQYSMDARQRRRQIKCKCYKSPRELEEKYFQIWFNKSSKLKTKKIVTKPTVLHSQVKTSVTRQKEEEITKVNLSQLQINSNQKERPTPRRPAFLFESLELTKNTDKKQKETVEEKPILLPPSAFTSIPVAPVDQKEQEVGPLDQKQNEVFTLEVIEENESNSIELLNFKKMIEDFADKSNRLK
jgi:hypothetical protein